jgi:creatinine amidohydrolase/Fe(II)-dependent formamide hydrolase-like protein
VQNPLGVDSLKAHHVACAVAEKLGGGAVFPALCMAMPRDGFYVTNRPENIERVAAALGAEPERIKGFCAHGGMDMQEQWLFYQRMVRMALENIAGFGFRSIYLVVGHHPLAHWAHAVAVAFTRASRMAGQPVTTDWCLEFEPAGLTGDHGGKWETSHMMAGYPGSVDLEEFERHPGYLGVGCGRNAPEASQAQGEQWVAQCAEAIAVEARWLVEHWPELPERHRHRR